LVLNSNINAILSHFKDISAFVRWRPLFSYPTPILAKISGCSLWSRFVMLGPAESEHPKLSTISRKQSIGKLVGLIV